MTEAQVNAALQEMNVTVQFLQQRCVAFAIDAAKSKAEVEALKAEIDSLKPPVAPVSA